MMNGVTEFSKLNAALAVMGVYAFCMATGFIFWIGMAFLDLGAGTQVLETVMHVMEGLDEHVLPAFQFLNGLLAWLVGFSILLECLNIDITLYDNSNPSRINPNKMSALSLRSKMITALPRVKYGSLRRRSDDVNRNDCAICLGCIEEEDGVRILPNCRHYFHISCIDRWLFLCTTNHSSCPLCRATVIGSGLPSKDISSLRFQDAH